MQDEINKIERKAEKIFQNDMEQVAQDFKREKRWFTWLYAFIVTANVLGIALNWGNSDKIVDYIFNIILFGIVYAWQLMYLGMKSDMRFFQALNNKMLTYLNDVMSVVEEKK